MQILVESKVVFESISSTWNFCLRISSWRPLMSITYLYLIFLKYCYRCYEKKIERKIIKANKGKGTKSQEMKRKEKERIRKRKMKTIRSGLLFSSFTRSWTTAAISDHATIFYPFVLYRVHLLFYSSVAFVCFLSFPFYIECIALSWRSCLRQLNIMIRHAVFLFAFHLNCFYPLLNRRDNTRSRCSRRHDQSKCKSGPPSSL